MRDELQRYSGQRRMFTATFDRSQPSTIKRLRGNVVLFKDIRVDDMLVADHAWMQLTEAFKIGLRHGERVRFQARVERYIKGYFGDPALVTFAKPIGVDYRLVDPRKVQRIPMEEVSK